MLCYHRAMRRDACKNAVRRSLLRWYDRHHRVLPWRAPPGDGARKGSRNQKNSCSANAYHVLVSEAMLQQTQVATVLAYFARFMEAFPTVEALAAADEQRVLRLWQGLGYYRRARHLHAAARIIVQQHGGRVPEQLGQLLSLPGVGRYSAGAIASIAYQQPAPILDGNVARVLSRLFAIRQPIDATAAKNQLWQLAGELVSPSRPGDFNQALMDLGATVCTPRQPRCADCPLHKLCTTRSDELPIKTQRTTPRPVTHTILALHRRGRYLFEQRNPRGLWSNMWQLTTAEQRIDDPVNWIKDQFGLSVSAPRTLESFTHHTTHRTIRFELLTATVLHGKTNGQTQWRALDDLDDLPLPNPQRKAIKALLINDKEVEPQRRRGRGERH